MVGDRGSIGAIKHKELPPMITAYDTAAANPVAPSTSEPAEGYPAEVDDYAELAEVAAPIGEYGYDDTLAEVDLTLAGWVDALRATEVAQAIHYLKVDDGGGPGFCCLGLACELSGAGAWGIPDCDDAYEYVYLVGAPVADAPVVPRDAGPTGHLPEVIRGALGLRTNLGAFWVTPEWLAALSLRAPEVAAKLSDYLGKCWLDPDSAANVTLSALNDNGLTFAEIAEVIDSNPPGLLAE